MIVLGILAIIFGIGAMCYLLFNLAVYALPLYIGIMAGQWAYSTGAGGLGAFAVGVAASIASYVIGQLCLIFIKPIWAKLIIVAAFVAPAAFAGYHATHGLAKLAMPSETWQVVFSVVGAIAIGITGFARILSFPPPAQA
ncbi:hypothetical protein [Asticcacaulis endophyticus]|uniref:Uncharacterized protein n=1 Tax=Asticcacaulis endophyticus TaxID=1395890 RepID=A0A918Q3S9_9CAUL|nr:hypothetical protein [Asticcacaulis endophyticus]GGZ32633.1 hypothetical protein GCM10011273_18510 [Asticcacaulis endophyticus]